MKGKVIYGKKDRYFIDDVEVTKKEFDATFPTRFDGRIQAKTMMQTSKAWPRLSDSMGVHPKQITEARKNLAERGVPTDFTKDGRMIVRDNAHQRDVQKALQVYNRDGGYGQITG